MLIPNKLHQLHIIKTEANIYKGLRNTIDLDVVNLYQAQHSVQAKDSNIQHNIVVQVVRHT